MATPSEADRTEQIIAQFRKKILHVILESRIPHPRFASALPGHSPDHTVKNDRWFNLALGDVPAPPADVPGGFMDPLVVDVLLIRCGGEGEGDVSDCASEDVVERWSVKCVDLDSWSAAPQRPHDGCFDRRTYKKSVILLRSVYVLLRLLPAQRVCSLLCSSSQAYNYDLTYRVPSFETPFSRAEAAELKRYSFTPVETLFGQLVVSVQYRPSLANFPLAVASLMPPIIIPDYVDSAFAERFRPFPASLTDRVSRHFTSQHPPRDIPTPAIPLLDPSGRNSDRVMHQPSSSAPGRSVLELGHLQAAHCGRPVLQEQPFSESRKTSNFDYFKLSPPMLTSSSISPPPHGGSSLQSRSRSDPSLMSIPICPPTDSSSLPLPPLSPRNTRPDISSQESASRSRSFRKPEVLNQGVSTSSPMCAPKGPKDGRDDYGKFSAFSYVGPPRFFSRSLSKQSKKDDEEEDFTCPFAVDDVGTLDSQTRSRGGKEESDYTSAHKSQEAAVGALVRMLRTAAPLRQDHSCSLQSSESNAQVSTSSPVLSRKTSEALEELQGYKEMKNLLLCKSGGRSPESPRKG